ncbi:hypothetical protein Tco_0936462, partial [Tanacetum coccineum]
MLHPLEGAQLEPQGGDKIIGVLSFEVHDMDVSDDMPRLEGIDRLDYGLGLESSDGFQRNIEKECRSSSSSKDSYLGLRVNPTNRGLLMPFNLGGMPGGKRKIYDGHYTTIVRDLSSYGVARYKVATVGMCS